MTTLAAAEVAMIELLDDLDGASLYRGQRLNYDYPAVVVAPSSMNLTPAMGDPRDVTLDVVVIVEVTDEDAVSDTVSDLIEAVTDIIREAPEGHELQQVEFGVERTADNRLTRWARIPVAMYL